mmetsp:Transcript_61852/g.69270  ORF Transcript_61852/g.69270 Transcript_61852/m.69270 type:complete len:84 (-) Transcript_61852:59-310(-)
MVVPRKCRPITATPLPVPPQQKQQQEGNVTVGSSRSSNSSSRKNKNNPGRRQQRPQEPLPVVSSKPWKIKKTILPDTARLRME